MSSLQVGHVEALDSQRNRVQPQRLLQAVQRLDALLAPALGPQLLLVDRQPRVALGQLEDAAFVAALRKRHVHVTYHVWPVAHTESYWHAHMAAYLNFYAAALAACSTAAS